MRVCDLYESRRDPIVSVCVALFSWFHHVCFIIDLIPYCAHANVSSAAIRIGEQKDRCSICLMCGVCVCGRRERGLRVAPLLHACPRPPRACVFAREPRCLCVQSVLMGVCVTMLCCFKVSDRSKCGRDAELETTDGTSEWRSLGSPRRTVPLSFPETLTCDVLLRCPRVGFSGAVRGTQSSAHPGRSTAREIVQAERVGTEGRTGRETRDRDE